MSSGKQRFVERLLKRYNSKRDFPQPILFLHSTTSSITPTITYMVVPMSNRVLYRVLFRVLFRVLSDSFLFRVLSSWVLLNVLIQWVLSKFSPCFAVCHVPSVEPTMSGVFHLFSVLNIKIATDVLIFSVGNSMQLPEIYISS